MVINSADKYQYLPREDGKAFCLDRCPSEADARSLHRHFSVRVARGRRGLSFQRMSVPVSGDVFLRKGLDSQEERNLQGQAQALALAVLSVSGAAVWVS